MSKAIIVVDVQNDFCEGGSLAVGGGSEVARAISSRLAEGGYEHAVATRDHHIDPGHHFSDSPDFADTWPPHCVVGTSGVALHPNLETARIEAVFDKGEYAAAYSGFEAVSDGTLLADWLREHGVDTVEVVGIATDHCVRATALDAARARLRHRDPARPDRRRGPRQHRPGPRDVPRGGDHADRRPGPAGLILRVFPADPAGHAEPSWVRSRA